MKPKGLDGTLPSPLLSADPPHALLWSPIPSYLLLVPLLVLLLWFIGSLSPLNMSPDDNNNNNIEPGQTLSL